MHKNDCEFNIPVLWSASYMGKCKSTKIHTKKLNKIKPEIIVSHSKEPHIINKLYYTIIDKQ